MVETGLVDAAFQGLITGSIIALGALSLSLLYSIAEVPNFAHGDMITLGAYFALVLNVPSALPFVGDVFQSSLYVALFGAVVFGALLGAGLELGLLRGFRRQGADLITMIIVTMGLSFVLRNVVIFVIGPGSRTYETASVVSVFYDFYLTGAGVGVRTVQRQAGDLITLASWGYPWGFLLAIVLAAGAVAYGAYRWRTSDAASTVARLTTPKSASVIAFLAVFAVGLAVLRGSFLSPDAVYTTRLSVNDKHVLIFGVSLAIMLGIHVLLKLTKLGTAMRATADNMDLAHVTGINTDRVQFIVWVLAGALTALAGVLIGWFASLHPNMGFNLLLPVFAAVIVGGITSPYGAVAGSFLIGLSMDVGVFLLPTSFTRYRIALPFVVLLVVILIRPQGLWEGY